MTATGKTGEPSLEARLALAERLEAAAPALAHRCIDAMYADPFWMARFGAFGRQHAEADAAYHVRYLVTALREGASSVLTHYAQWLRGVLASRGMCTWHLTESFRTLTRAMDDEAIADHAPAAALFAEGARALAYADGPAGIFETAAPALAARVRAALGPRAARLDELLSFTADALARDDGASVTTHVAFVLHDLLKDDPAARDHFQATVEALARAAIADLPDDLAARVPALLAVPAS